MTMILNQKAIDAINEAKELIVIRIELQAQFARAELESKQGKIPIYKDPWCIDSLTHGRCKCYYKYPDYSASMWETNDRLLKVYDDLRAVHKTILIHLGVYPKD